MSFAVSCHACDLTVYPRSDLEGAGGTDEWPAQRRARKGVKG